MPQMKEIVKAQWVHPDGTALCLVCMAPARAQPPPRAGGAAGTSRAGAGAGAGPSGHPPQVVNSLVDLCCGQACFDRMQLTTWAPALRLALFEVERGVCQARHADSHLSPRCCDHRRVDTRGLVPTESLAAN